MFDLLELEYSDLVGVLAPKLTELTYRLSKPGFKKIEKCCVADF